MSVGAICNGGEAFEERRIAFCWTEALEAEFQAHVSDLLDICCRAIVKAQAMHEAIWDEAHRTAWGVVWNQTRETR